MGMFNKCPRKEKDCEPILCYHSGETFVCAGLNDGTTREIETDVIRHCWKTGQADEMNDMDLRDIAHTIAVLSHAQGAYLETVEQP